VLTTPESRACLRVLGAYADSIDDTDLVGADERPLPPRTRAQKMADVLCELILRPGHLSPPVIQAQLLIVASVETLAGGDQPGEVDGQTVPAEMVRHLARAFGLVPDTAAEAAPTPPATDDDVPDRLQPPLNPPVDAPAGYRVADPQTGWRDAAPWEREWLESIERAGAFSDVPAGAEAERRFLEEIWALEAGVPVQTPAAPAPAPSPARPSHAPAPSPKTTPSPDERRTPPADWSVADTAVRSASAAVEEARRAVALADRQVEAAEHRAADDEDSWAASAAGQVTGAADSVRALAAASTEQRAAIAGLLTRTSGGGLADRPRVAVVDALSGTLLALTDATELRRLAHCGRSACARRTRVCTHDLPDTPGLAPPPETGGYRPSAALDRFIRARDRRCRFPGCRRLVPRGGELDHDRPYPDGPTAQGNLAGYCTRNHRGKHQAPGWTHVLHPDGRLTVTTPTGLTTTTTPESYNTRPLTIPAEPAPF